MPVGWLELVSRDVAAEFPYRVDDARIVGGDDHRVDVARGRRAAIDVLDHRPSRRCPPAPFPGNRVDA